MRQALPELLYAGQEQVWAIVLKLMCRRRGGIRGRRGSPQARTAAARGTPSCKAAPGERIRRTGRGSQEALQEGCLDAAKSNAE